MTPEHCESQIHRLSVLRGMPADTYEYFAALEDVPDERFTSAVNHALKTRHWFPTPAELRADCDAVGKVVAFSPPTAKFEAAVGGGYDVTFVNPLPGAGHKSITVRVDRVWRFDCTDCEDTGWRSHQCPSLKCQRHKEHAAHEWVEHCHCVDWNPTLRRRKEATAKYSHEPERVGS